MSGHDEDIDFDFFAEPAPEPPRRRLVRRPSGPPPGGQPPPRRPGAATPAATPALRLALLVVFAIAVILIFVFAVRSCENANAAGPYRDYMNSLAPIASDSTTVGKQLQTLLANQNMIENQLETKLLGLKNQQQIDAENVAKLSPPGPLRQQNQDAVEALQLRVDGLNGLLNVFKETSNQRGSTAATTSGIALSQEMYKLVASDVVWAELFASSSKKVLESRGVSGVTAPASVFLADPDTANRNSMSSIWERIHGFTPSSSETSITGQHGTGIAYVKVTPSKQVLSLGTTATIPVASNLGFDVGVEDTGDYMESDVKVTLTIQQAAPYKTITRQQTIGQIFNGETKDAIFKAPFTIGTMIRTVPITVDVAPVPGETNLTNNKYTYEVSFGFS